MLNVHRVNVHKEDLDIVEGLKIAILPGEAISPDYVPCTMCNLWAFRKKDALYRHLEEIHGYERPSKDKNSKCSFCGDSSRNHVCPYLTCKDCKQVFAKKETLEESILAHSRNCKAKLKAASSSSSSSASSL